MRIISEKIPAKFTNLPATYELLNRKGDDAFMLVIAKLYRTPGSPNGASCSFQQIGKELMSLVEKDIYFKFYTSKNPFIGHNVISHATDKNTVNYNKRFHSVEAYTIKDWFKNFFHECTHLADQSSVYNFDHANQKDEYSAPIVVARTAGIVFDENVSKWI